MDLFDKQNQDFSKLFKEKIEQELKDELLFSLFFKKIEIKFLTKFKIIIVSETETSSIYLKKHYGNFLVKIAKELDKKLEDVLFSHKSDEIEDILKNSDQKMKFLQQSNLDTLLTFENYVGSSFNDNVVALSTKLFDNLNAIYSPIFIYGKSGFGKTHFLHAIGNKYVEYRKSVCFLSSDNFTTSFVKVLGTNDQEKITNFINAYKLFDVLLFDDIQQYASRTATLSALFNLINYFIENRKQIFICSDKEPTLLGGFEERFITRFQGGLTFQIKTPTSADYVKILKKKLENRNYKIDNWSPEALDFIVSNFSDSIRSLEGAVNKIVFYTTDSNDEYYSYQHIKKIFKFEDLKTNFISSEKIIKRTCDYYKISKNTLLSKARKKNAVQARDICIWLLKSLLNITLKEIGELIGNRNHSTILYSLKKIEDDLKVNDAVDLAIKTIKRNIKSIN